MAKMIHIEVNLKTKGPIQITLIRRLNGPRSLVDGPFYSNDKYFHQWSISYVSQNDAALQQTVKSTTSTIQYNRSALSH